MDGETTTRSTIPSFQFDRDKLNELAARHSSAFQNGEPFPHVVIPNFLPLDIAMKLAKEFPEPTAIDWHLDGPGTAKHTRDKNIEKISCSNESDFPPFIRHVMHEFNSGIFIDFVSELTGFTSLMPDPWFGGCGLHSSGRGGRLMIHADASRHPNTKMQQLVNMIYYVTPAWQDEWGGSLELWDTDATHCVKKIKPEFNSMLIFFTGTRSFHGHPHPITSPSGVRRNTMAAYYYTTNRTVDEHYSGPQKHVTWVPTNQLDTRVTIRRKFREAIHSVLPSSLASKFEAIVRGRRAAS